MPDVTGVLETCLYFDDLERAAGFYENLLGFRKLFGDDRFCVFSVADRQVLLVFKRGGTLEPIALPGGIIPPHDGNGHLHLAFSIPAAELPAWEKHLAAKGVAIESKVSWPLGGWSIYFRDPEQHLVELVTPGCWPIY
ncbi:MAG: VOC family protein [Candidatus Acidiferrales bacterium]